MNIDLNSLTIEEERNLANLLALRESKRGKTKSDMPRLWVEVWDQVNLIVRAGSLTDFLTKFGKRAYGEACQELDGFARNGATLMRTPIRLSVIEVSLRCLAKRLRKQYAFAEGYQKMSATALLENLDQLEDACDDAYPGYYGAGLLSRVALAK